MKAPKVLAAALVGLTVWGGACAFAADAIEDFYRGKTISLWVGYGTGGGYDNTARLFAPHYGDYIPGKPRVVVQNVTGAGSLLAANNLYNVAPKDGSVIGLFSSTVAMMPLYGDQNAKFDTQKFGWIGNIHRDLHACGVWRGAGQDIRTLQDLIAAKTTVVFGSDGGDAPLTRWALFMKNVLGANLKVVAGYKGTREINLAMQSGEVGGSCGMFESTVRTAYLTDYQKGDLRLFVQTGYKRNAPFFGDATNLYSLFKTEEEVQMARLVFGVNEITRPITAPPGVPADRLAALRKAFVEVMKDPRMIEDAKRLGLELDPMPADELIGELDALFKTPKEIVAKSSVATSTP